MKAKPYFKERVATCDGSAFYGQPGFSTPGIVEGQKLRITDARRPSALRAVEKVLQHLLDRSYVSLKLIESLADDADMTANVRAGRVKCDWKKEPTK